MPMGLGHAGANELGCHHFRKELAGNLRINNTFPFLRLLGPAKTPTLGPASSLGRANQYTFPFLRLLGAGEDSNPCPRP